MLSRLKQGDSNIPTVHFALCSFGLQIYVYTQISNVCKMLSRLKQGDLNIPSYCTLV